MGKQAERDYARTIKQEGLYRRPYGTPRVVREFAGVLELFFRHLPDGGRVLDLGCGPGWTTLFLARAGFEVLGVDIAERMVEIARERAARENVAAEFQVADMEELDLPAKDFDGVLLFDSLHHCDGYAAVLRRACAHLRPGGVLLLMEPSWLHRYSPHARAATRKYGVTELGFTRFHLTRVLKQAGFRTVRHYYDGGDCYRGLAGFLLAQLRLWCGFLAAYPRMKQIVLAVK